MIFYMSFIFFEISGPNLKSHAAVNFFSFRLVNKTLSIHALRQNFKSALYKHKNAPSGKYVDKTKLIKQN